MMTAALFGTGSAVGAFRVALTGTFVPVNFLTSDALNTAFIPFYKRSFAESVNKAQTFLWALLCLFAILSILIGLGLWLTATSWIGVLAPGLDTETGNIAVMMLKVMSIGVPFYLMSAVLMFVAMANDDFVPMSLRPSIQNIGLIIGVSSAFILHNPTLFAWGFTACYVMFSGWILFRVTKSGFLAMPDRFDRVKIHEVLQAFWVTLRPLLLLPFILQGNIVVERMVASLVGLVAVSALDYARFVTETLLLLISVPVAFAGLTHWSGLSLKLMRDHLRRVTLLLLLLAIPASAFLMRNAHLIVQVIYARGAFNEQSVRVTGDILFGTSFGLWAQIIGYVAIKALSAQIRNHIVLWIMGCALLANIATNLLMYHFLGALTIGLGNSVYGLVLLAGALSALSLWHDIWKKSKMIFLGGIGYLLFTSCIPLPENVWAKLSLSSLIAICYWAVWIAALSDLRNLSTRFLKRDGEKYT